MRSSRKLSQQDLADKLGTSKSSVNMYERGEREPNLEMLECIADFFNVDMDYLLGKSQIANQALSQKENIAPRFDLPYPNDVFLNSVIAVYTDLSEVEKSAVKKFFVQISQALENEFEMPDDICAGIPDDDQSKSAQPNDDELEDFEINIAARGGNSGTLTGKKKKGESIFDRPDYRGGRR